MIHAGREAIKRAKSNVLLIDSNFLDEIGLAAADSVGDAIKRGITDPAKLDIIGKAAGDAVENAVVKGITDSKLLQHIGSASASAVIDAIKSGIIDPVELARIGKAVAEAEELFAELIANGVKFSREATQWIKRTPNGNITWLEIGSDSAGLQHIMLRHSGEFSSWGYTTQSAVSDLIMKSVSTQVGTEISTGVRVYDVIVNGVTKKMKVVTGSNGFIVTAHPYTP